MISKLYIIATPLGNLGDITLRACEMMRCLEFFFAEDSREFQKLLMALNIPADGKKVFSYASHNLKEATEKAINLLKEGKSLGLVTDRGTPGISDPGARLVSRAHEEGISVVPVPGPSSVAAIISVSGVDSTAFEFGGFLPLQEKQRGLLFERLARAQTPYVFFESPKRIRGSLIELKKHFPNGRIFMGREMTKKFEEYRWIVLSEFESEMVPELGEYAVVLEPGICLVEEDWKKEIALRLAPDKEWAKDVARRHNLSSSEVYNTLQKQK